MSFHLQTAGRRTKVDRITAVFRQARTIVSKKQSPDFLANLTFKIVQGGTFSAFLSRVRAAQGPKADTTPYLYNIAFTKTQGVDYCSDQGPGTCDADANMWIGRAPAGNGGNWVNPFRKRDLMQPKFNHYISKRGEFFTSIGEMSPGEKLYHARMDPILEERARANPDKDALVAFYANPDNYEMVEDEMERLATREEAAALA